MVIVRSCWFESSTGHSGPGNAVAGAFFLGKISGLIVPNGVYLDQSGVYLHQFGIYLNGSGIYLNQVGFYLNHFGFSTWMIAKSNIGKVPNQNAYHPWVQGTCGENT